MSAIYKWSIYTENHNLFHVFLCKDQILSKGIVNSYQHHGPDEYSQVFIACILKVVLSKTVCVLTRKNQVGGFTLSLVFMLSQTISQQLHIYYPKMIKYLYLLYCPKICHHYLFLFSLDHEKCYLLYHAYVDTKAGTPECHTKEGSLQIYPA